MKRREKRWAWFILVSLALPALAGGDWPRFRGPGGAAVSTDQNLPVTWSSDSGIAWKSELPGAGASSPITTGDRVFVTCYSGYGVDRGRPGNIEDLQRHLVCLDRNTGRILWQKDLKAKLPEDPYRPPGTATHGYASSTPVTDGRRVYAFFGKSGVVAFDMQGEQVWQADVGSNSDFMAFGSGASPILYKDFVIVTATVEGEAIVALDKTTGEEVWKAAAQGYGGSWSTPIVVAGDDGNEELVVSVSDEVWGLNPASGKLRWYVQTNFGQPICPSVVAKDGVIFAFGGRRPGQAFAIRAGGRGDGTESRILWNHRRGSYVPSPVVYGDHLYWVNDRGVVHCADPATGEIVYQERLAGAGQVYASVVAGDAKLYAVTRQDGTFVVAAKPQFEQLAHNQMSDDPSIFNASPAITNGQLLLRSDRFIYCIGEPARP